MILSTDLKLEYSLKDYFKIWPTFEKLNLNPVLKDSDADFNVGFAIGSLQSNPSDFGVFVAINGLLLKAFEAVRDESGLFKEKKNSME